MSKEHVVYSLPEEYLRKVNRYYELWRGLPRNLPIESFDLIKGPPRCEGATPKRPAMVYETSEEYIWAEPGVERALNENTETLLEALVSVPTGRNGKIKINISLAPKLKDENEGIERIKDLNYGQINRRR